MKNLILLMAILFLGCSFSVWSDDSQVDDLFSGGTREFEFERFDDNQVMLQIARDAELVCHSGLCTLTSISQDNQGFTASFNIGNGPVGFGNFGNGAVGGGGTFIGIGGNNVNSTDYWGINLSYHNNHCEQRINVPRSLYFAINRYMYGLMTEEGGTRRGFTPADEAMIMFYTTIMKQANGCTANSGR